MSASGINKNGVPIYKKYDNDTTITGRITVNEYLYEYTNKNNKNKSKPTNPVSNI